MGLPHKLNAHLSLLSFACTQKHTHFLCLGDPLVGERGAQHNARNPPKHDKLNPLVHTVTRTHTETQADPLKCNMPICSAPENDEGEQSSGG